MQRHLADIYTEPTDIDVETLRNLGPLSGMAGIFEGTRSLDINPKAHGPERQEFVEHIALQPIDPQTNGPQLFYGLRYHTRIVKLIVQGRSEPFHHRDRSLLKKVGQPTPNPLARGKETK